MARITGTSREFKRFIGPHLRNVVQQVSRKQKAALGACQHCGATGELDAAHVHGRDRTDIVDLLLGTSDPDAPIDVDLVEFESAFKQEHEPVERAILVLCTPCHRKYDSFQNPAATAGQVSSIRRTQPHLTHAGRDVLPISLFPAGHEDFKQKLLESREAVIEVLYADGSVDRRPWNASRFGRDSNVFGNLRSRPEFRQGAWQESGIVKVSVRVVD